MLVFVAFGARHEKSYLNAGTPAYHLGHGDAFGDGFAFVPFSLAVVAANVAGSRIAAAVGPVSVLLAGLMAAVVGAAALVWMLGAETTYSEELPAQLLARVGIGLAVPTMTTLLLASVPDEVSGVASGAFTTVRKAGAAVGVAAYGALMAADPLAGLRVSLAVSATLLLAAAAVASARLRQR